jgi:hypothetical protein
LKLLQFNDLYFQDEDAIHNLYQLINDEDDSRNKAKTRKQKKSTVDSKNSAKPTSSKATTKKTARKTIKNKKNI